MATTPPRLYSAQVIHAIRGRVAFNTTGIATGVEIGKIPAGSFIKGAIVNVETAFNAATTNVLTVGKSGTIDAYATNAELAAGTAGYKSGNKGAASGNTAADTSVIVTYTQTGTAATTGVADIIVEYYPFAS